ncbi:MAG: glutamine amidotransferase, partial [Gammaproteobacteria bacterium]|nr:glutamine amidotransferase [Gammaproteobacteria bacterium]
MGDLKTVNVIRHLAFEDLGSFGSVLEAHGYLVNYFEAADYALKPDELSQIDALSDSLLVVLGGPISVNDTAMFPFLDEEVGLLKQRIAADNPT